MEQNQSAAPAEPVANAEVATEEKAVDQKVVAKTEKVENPLENEEVDITVNGKVRKMKWKDAKAYLQRDIAADEKFREAAKQRKELETLFKSVKDNPKKLRELIKLATGEEATAVFERELAAELEELTMDPKEKEVRNMRKKLEEYEKKEAAAREKEEAEKRSKAQEYWETKYDKDISEALKSSNLPINEDTIRYTAEIMLAQIEDAGDDGFEPPMSIVMDLVRERYIDSMGKMAKTMDPEKLLELLGDDGLDKLSKAAQNKKKRPANISKENQVLSDEAPKSDAKKAWKSRDEFEQRIRDWEKS
jgi:hypothetical protein